MKIDPYKGEREQMREFLEAEDERAEKLTQYKYRNWDPPQMTEKDMNLFKEAQFMTVGIEKGVLDKQWITTQVDLHVEQAALYEQIVSLVLNGFPERALNLLFSHVIKKHKLKLSASTKKDRDHHLRKYARPALMFEDVGRGRQNLMFIDTNRLTHWVKWHWAMANYYRQCHYIISRGNRTKE